MKKLAFFGGAAALSAAALFTAPLSQAADHLDGAAVMANKMADLNDVYAWMTSDGAKVNLALTVSPIDDGTRMFGPSVQYVFHVVSHVTPSQGQFPMPGVESKIICTFASDTDGQCWVVDPSNKVVDYVKGDLSNSNGRLAESGKFRVFAGRRSDPFFFNLGGFLQAQAAVKQNGGALQKDAAGCPDTRPAGTATTLRALISNPPGAMTGPCAAGEIDCFANFNVMSIVVQVDKELVLSGTDSLLSVWASTHAGQ